MLGIINYKIGNLASVQNAFKRLNQEVVLIEDPQKVKICSLLVLPGVGAFGDAMEHLRRSGMQEAILEYVKSGKYLLGICLGMQLLFQRSEEFGEHLGLGLLEGEVLKIRGLKKGEKIPHMGWNLVKMHQDSPLFKGIPTDFYLYFVHSFCVRNLSNAIGVSHYGIEFASIVQKDNIIGIQPHPEKSHNVGLKILQNFIHLKD
ncbi:imidazole glycerol phosphate synthase subunit HisH [Helicobacter apodemus]|uniref:Imidazole glycerol phosphate synthase subunit HisH n=1 Tax=Helicobacter apodemus TaxID=135569 RepID=A0A2U8FFT6_9HELI|nr:imidazole glycerol phosphate synthase subunit HisH [Helicobacter apodemus]AWI35089.1 imidazole glycerol phosphate synthase subunit HisH [Helicobacter apodemus]